MSTCFSIGLEDKVLTPALWQAYADIIAEAGMEVYEGMAAVLVEEQAPPDASKVQSIFDMRELQEQMGNQLHAVHDVLAASWEGDENGKISSLDIWRLLGLLSANPLSSLHHLHSHRLRAAISRNPTHHFPYFPLFCCRGIGSFSAKNTTARVRVS
jgi:hypothetical protein